MAAGLMISLLSGNVFAEEKLDGLELWWSGGHHNGTVKFQESVPGFSQSLLEFKPNGYFYVGGGARYQFVNSDLPRLSLSFEAFSARDYDGTVKDTDVLSISASPFIYSESTGSGKQNSYDVNLGWQLLNAKDGKEKLDLLVGYTNEDYKFQMSNVVTQIYDYANAGVITLGHAASYDCSFHGTYFGLANVATLMNNKLKIDASVKYLPDINGDGTGDWQLRGISFKHDGQGEGYKAAIGASVLPVANWEIGLKVTQTSYKIDGSSRTLNRYTGELIGESDLDYLKDNTYTTELKVGYIF